MAEWARPFNQDINLIAYGWLSIARECKLLGYLGIYSIEHTPQLATPYIDLYVVNNPAM
jgi:hypothetical protein